jgi:hypothetical protein
MMLKSPGALKRGMLAILMMAFVAGPTALLADERAERVVLARQVVELFGDRSRFDTWLNDNAAIVANYRATRPDLPALTIDEIKAAARKMLEGLNDDTAAMYADNFTTSELKQLIEFGASPLGKKIRSYSSPSNPALVKLAKDRFAAFRAAMESKPK